MLRMILPILLILWPLAAPAWVAGRVGVVCTLTNDAGDVVLTHDPTGPIYTITVAHGEAWPDAEIFGIAFQGAEALTITTDRHVRSADGRAITVTDRGFGNVLAGLSRNLTATAFAGPASVGFSLAGAAPAVAIFETCDAPPTA
ncbi:MAG: hypothetical protein RLZZ491_2089 [Pseudomonadota bacterium]|jgi:hypothetical protein